VVLVNAFKYLIDFETDGLHLFETLADDSRNPELKATFTLLAAAQRRHLTRLTALKKSTLHSTAVAVRDMQMPSGANGFKRLLGCSDTCDELKWDADALWHVLSAEEECIKLLEEVTETAVGFAPRQLLVQMVKEEREQFGRVLAIYDFAKKPHTVLEWGAFSSRQGGQLGSRR
jgi:rubrerythrin